MIEWNPWVGCVFLLYIQIATSVTPNCTVVAYPPSLGPLQTQAYTGATFHPALNAVVFTPFLQADEPTRAYHRVDCGASAVPRQYNHTLVTLPVNAAYAGNGAYHAGLNRLYFPPFSQAPETLWHYMNETGGLVEYPHNTIELSYWGAVYCPVAQDLYFIPHNAATQTLNVYVNGTGHVNTYAGVASGALAYRGGALCPNQQRIIMSPFQQGATATWHTIDCPTRTVAPYTHGAAGLNPTPYSGAVYHPAIDRVYFVPFGQAVSNQWHYYDCGAASVQSYFGRMTLPNAYTGGGLVAGHVVFAPFTAAPRLFYDMIDFTGVAASYSNAFTGLIGTSDFIGGAVCSVGDESRLYLSPSDPSTPNWHYITCTPGGNNTDAPTTAPSSPPSSAPSQAPATQSPSVFPSKLPTSVPTSSPTVANPTPEPPTLSPTPTNGVFPLGSVITGSVVFSSTVDVSGGSLAVDGNITFTPGATLVVGTLPNTINSTAAVILSGSLTIVLGSKPLSSVTVDVISGQSVVGTFSAFNATVPGGLESCEMFVIQPIAASSSFSALVTIDTSACGLHTGAIVGIAAGCALIVIALIVLMVRLYRRKVVRVTKDMNDKLRANEMADIEERKKKMRK